ncbi:hypothetical protein [Terricaulis silvestris]|uniref:Uncharacterized protein n=1 Tax=Terricaulis silvestris TaxID=2686094 RepID=A0A6I6MP94_9CAUL|nr:hypothetical protein [Terricaulis silvestris]QGZ95166.1 hypothetical protein DSM104635_02010 [Terricaulis silvestris]
MPTSTIWHAEESPLDEFEFVEIENVTFSYYGGPLEVGVSVRKSPRRFSVTFAPVWAFDFTDEFFDAMSGQQAERGQLNRPARIYRSDETPRVDHFRKAIQPAFAEHGVGLSEFYILAMANSISVVCQGGYRVREVTQ